MADAIDLTDDATPATAAPAADADVAELEEQLNTVEEELLELEETLAALHSRQAELRRQKEELQRRISAEKRAPKTDWSCTAFAWDQRLKTALHSVFSLQEFRPLQREVINATLHGRDVLLLLPSGGGKSLCYQLPALISGGVTLVVSPLLSLIVDQVMGLAGRVQAYALTSLTSKEEAAVVMAALTAAAAGKAGKQKAADGAASQALLLYVTPEKIVASKRLMAKLEKIYQAGCLSRIAIDEAHCCSTWGNDFRPDYKKLGVLKQQFPDTPIIALTATATMQVCRDITSILRIDGAEQFAASINRPNLKYEVRRKSANADAASEDICTWIQEESNGESGIVYCLTRKDCEVLAGQLQASGISAAHYHADMDPAARTAAHNTWSSGAVQVMVATIAFGMGINKPDVRWVLHACLSKSLENYYQESGRAGRDGQPARCVLCYRFGDVLRQAAVVCMDPSWQRHLIAMTGYAAAASGCRRAKLAAHFAEGPAACNGMCDLCTPTAVRAAGGVASNAGAALSTQPQQEDITAGALYALAALEERKGEKRATLNQLLDDMPKAARKAAAASKGCGNKSAPLNKDVHEWIIEQMLLQGLLGLEFGFTAYMTNTYLVATTAGKAFHAAQGRQRLTAARPSWLPSQQHDQQQPGLYSGPNSSRKQHQPQVSTRFQDQEPSQLQQRQSRNQANKRAAAEVISSTDDSDDEDFQPVAAKQKTFG